jgi:plasmid maintenance system killer protein
MVINTIYDFVNMLIQRLLKDIRDIQNIEMLVKNNIKNNLQILKNIEKSLLSIEFNQQYLMKYLEDGYLSKVDLLDFYQREEIRAKYKLISKEIESLGNE